MIKLNEDLPHAFVYPEAVKILNRLKDIQENTIGSIGDSGFHIYLQKTIPNFCEFFRAPQLSSKL